MEEKVYLGDWLYNAGIVGLLKIYDFNESNNDIVRGDNYISFDRKILTDFHDKYFSFIYEKANTIKDKTEKLNSLLLSKDTTEKDIKEYIKKITTSKTMKKDTSIASVLTKAKGASDWRATADRLLKSLPEHWERNKDLYSKYYLQGFYEGKSILNATVTSNIKKLFERDFVKPLFDKDKPKKKTHHCKVCNDRTAKKIHFLMKVHSSSPAQALTSSRIFIGI